MNEISGKAGAVYDIAVAGPNRGDIYRNDPVSYTHLQEVMWSEEKINRKLEEIMGNAFLSVWDTATGRKISPRMAAYLIAVKRVVEAKKIRGIWP